MNIYVSHSSGYDFKTQLYEPLRSAMGSTHTFIFPHDNDTESANPDAKDAIRRSDVVVAEVSRPSTGQGIELGWADDAGVPIICMYVAGAKISSALAFIGAQHIEYHGADDMIRRLNYSLKQR